MADVHTKRNTIVLAVVAIVALAAVGGGAYYLGTRNSADLVQQQPLRTSPQLTRLPVQRFGSWALSCVQNAQGAKRCSLGLTVVERQRKQAILKLGLIATKKGPAMIVLTPPNALIPAGFTMVPEKAQGVRVPYTRCMPRACEAIFLVSDQLATALRTSPNLQVRFVAGSGRPVAFQIPIGGFGDGYGAWQNNDPAAHDMPPPAPAPAPAATSAPSAPAKTPARAAKPAIVPKPAPTAPDTSTTGN
ncbi:MAG: invasion associated locus B family protein [Alphaproteobacteria bacterium]|nr:invasion associated locus B family protein [Alphaproteobacteria bacterium]